ncbi:MAG: DUF134 domain-containing protein, partial [Candidatus Aenigmatarchaeota archaeon]
MAYKYVIKKDGSKQRFSKAKIARGCRKAGAKPAGVPVRELKEVILPKDELEAVRLKDGEGMEQTAAARRMGISQPTFFRLLGGARKKIADALVNGKALKIEGGTYIFVHKKRF